jgi:hypothetical protein
MVLACRSGSGCTPVRQGRASRLPVVPARCCLLAPPPAYTQALSEQEDELASLTAVVRTHNLMAHLRGRGGGSRQPAGGLHHSHNSIPLAGWRAGRMLPFGVSSDSSDDDDEGGGMARRGAARISSDTGRDQQRGGGGSRGLATAAGKGGWVAAPSGLMQVQEEEDEDAEEEAGGSPGLVSVPGTRASVSARRLQVATSLLSRDGTSSSAAHGLGSITRHSMPGLKSLSLHSGGPHKSHSAAGTQGAVQSRLLELTGRYREAAKKVGAV